MKHSYLLLSEGFIRAPKRKRKKNIVMIQLCYFCVFAGSCFGIIIVHRPSPLYMLREIWAPKWCGITTISWRSIVILFRLGNNTSNKLYIFFFSFFCLWWVPLEHASVAIHKEKKTQKNLYFIDGYLVSFWLLLYNIEFVVETLYTDFFLVILFSWCVHTFIYIFFPILVDFIIIFSLSNDIEEKRKKKE